MRTGRLRRETLFLGGEYCQVRVVAVVLLLEVLTMTVCRHSLAGLHAPTFYDRYMAFNLKPSVYHFGYAILRILHKLGLTHPSQMEALDSVAMCTFGCRDGGKLGIFTPMHLMIARKPLKKDAEKKKN